MGQGFPGDECYIMEPEIQGTFACKHGNILEIFILLARLIKLAESLITSQTEKMASSSSLSLATVANSRFQDGHWPSRISLSERRVRNFIIFAVIFIRFIIIFVPHVGAEHNLAREACAGISFHCMVISNHTCTHRVATCYSIIVTVSLRDQNI